jgi:hypothetical protein
MSLWRRTRTEVAGAWRSVRYDMGRRPPEPAVGPDVTSTGMSTFAGAVDQATGAPRRLVIVSAFGVLAVAGAAGTYIAVAGGFGALLTEKPAAAQPYPLTAAAPPAGDTSNAGLGQGPATVSRPDAVAAAAPPAVPVASAATAATPAAVPGPMLPRAPRVTAERAKPPAPRPCACPAPPVPTPTQPSPSPSASPTPSASPSEPAGPSASATPSASGSAEALQRRSHSPGY